MSKSIKVEMIYGFKTQTELTDEDKDILYKAGITASPICYTTDDETTDYIVGKNIVSLNSASEYKTVPSEMSNEDKEKTKKWLFETLQKEGFDVKEKPLQLFLNTYYF